MTFQAPPSGAGLESRWDRILQDYDTEAEDAAVLLNVGGTVKSILSAKQAQKMALFLNEKATSDATMTAFTFNAPLI